MSTPERDRIRRRRHDAARALQPPAIRLLIIAETTAAWLAIRIQDLAAEHVIPIGARLRDAVAKRLEAAGVPVVPRPVPAPVRDADPDFARPLRTALVHAGLDSLIRPLPAAR